ncbi:cytochrome b5-related protein isoform X2 [Anabrus simplex]|uniref:cytochrome b5-related protein isoform X2 n=1 Tax=Anabrus simplex TaxID=316456 RepID=UPI0034DD39D0
MGMGKQQYSSTLPGLWKYPSFRDEALKSGSLWLKGKKADDGAEGLWRIRDDLYDFSSWIHTHPGGSDWLELTKGTDITEAFEAHHISFLAERLLPNFHVRPATTKRNSPYTFEPDGFYRTLKSRVREALKGQVTGPTRRSIVSADALLTGSLATAIMAGAMWSYSLGALSGFLLTLTVISAHNFFHQKDNLRMYYFDLSFMSSREWRISHALSHHLYPNSLLDLEISMWEPILQWLPRPDKSLLSRYGPLVYSPILYATMFPVQLLIRITLYLKGHMKGPRKEDFIPLIYPLVIYSYGVCSVRESIIMWLWIITVASFCFGCIGLNAAHHHPEIFHDGDAPRANLDWGVQQLDAVRDRPIVSRFNFLALVTFGHHGLHHLFPTIDHGKLDKLNGILEKTCNEFNVPYRPSSVIELIKGQFQQCARIKPNLVPPGQ